MDFDDSQQSSPELTMDSARHDLEHAAANEGNLGVRREFINGSHVPTPASRREQAAGLGNLGALAA
jgi:hypothetical protein